MSETRFAIRTIQNNLVRIGGLTFKPDIPVPAKMEGQRFAFGRYRRGNRYEPFVCLWGTENEFRNPDADDHELYTENGVSIWCWWRTSEPPGEGQG